MTIGGLLVKTPGARDGWFVYRLTPKGRDDFGLMPDTPVPHPALNVN